jgi:hypothetical protein
MDADEGLIAGFNWNQPQTNSRDHGKGKVEYALSRHLQSMCGPGRKIDVDASYVFKQTVAETDVPSEVKDDHKHTCRLFGDVIKSMQGTISFLDKQDHWRNQSPTDFMKRFDVCSLKIKETIADLSDKHDINRVRAQIKTDMEYLCRFLTTHVRAHALASMNDKLSDGAIKQARLFTYKAVQTLRHFASALMRNYVRCLREPKPYTAVLPTVGSTAMATVPTVGSTAMATVPTVGSTAMEGVSNEVDGTGDIDVLLVEEELKSKEPPPSLDKRDFPIRNEYFKDSADIAAELSCVFATDVCRKIVAKNFFGDALQNLRVALPSCDHENGVNEARQQVEEVSASLLHEGEAVVKEALEEDYGIQDDGCSEFSTDNVKQAGNLVNRMYKEIPLFRQIVGEHATSQIFEFTPKEQELIDKKNNGNRLTIGDVCQAISQTGLNSASRYFDDIEPQSVKRWKCPKKFTDGLQDYCDEQVDMHQGKQTDLKPNGDVYIESVAPEDWLNLSQYRLYKQQGPKRKRYDPDVKVEIGRTKHEIKRLKGFHAQLDKLIKGSDITRAPELLNLSEDNIEIALRRLSEFKADLYNGGDSGSSDSDSGSGSSSDSGSDSGSGSGIDKEDK